MVFGRMVFELGMLRGNSKEDENIPGDPANQKQASHDARYLERCDSTKRRGFGYSGPNAFSAFAAPDAVQSTGFLQCWVSANPVDIALCKAGLWCFGFQLPIGPHGKHAAIRIGGGSREVAKNRQSSSGITGAVQTCLIGPNYQLFTIFFQWW